MKKVFFTIILGSVLTLMSCTTPIQSTGNNNPIQQDNNLKNLVTIDGVVNDQSDKPVSDVRITVKDNDKIIGTTTSDKDGKFTIKVPKAFSESYYIEAKKDLSDGNLSQAMLVNTGEKANFIGENKLRKTQVAVKPVPNQ